LLKASVLAFVLRAAVASAQPPPPAQPPAQATAAAQPRVFASTTGIVLNFIKADKTADFEAVVEKLKDALQKSPNAQRREQAASWRVFKSPDPGPAGTVVYFYLIDPAVKGADYSVSTILGEAFSGDELAALIKQYTEAYSTTGQNFVNLTLLSELGK
jgi:hypothetical protein